MSQLTIFDLNDDCLAYICKFLSFADKLRFAKVSPRAVKAVQLCDGSKYKEYNMIQLEGLPVYRIDTFFKLFGAYIKILGYREIDLDAQNISFTGRKRPLITSLIWNIKYLENLQQLVCEDCALVDEDILLLQGLRGLKTLVLNRNRALTGKYLDAFPELEELNLNYCIEIKPLQFIKICKSSKLLKTLEIVMCIHLTTDAIDEMSAHCQQLQKLHLSVQFNINSENIARLPKLEHLIINSAHTYPDASGRQVILLALAKHKPPHLTQLVLKVGGLINDTSAQCIASLKNLTKLSFLFCRFSDVCLLELCSLANLEYLGVVSCDFENSALLHVLRSCTKLKYLDIQDCKDINNDFVYNIINVLKEKSVERHEPLTLLAGGSSIQRQIKYDYRMYDTESLLRIEWDY